MTGDEREGERPDDAGRAGPRPGAPGGPPGSQPPLPEPRPSAGGTPPVQPGGVGLLLAEMVNTITRVLLGYLIIFWLSQFLGLENGGWVVLALWTLSGLLVLWPGADDILARYLFGLRRPTLVESQRLAPSWFGVGQRAGIDPRLFSMWIQMGEVPTAGVAGGRTVAVTSWAVNGLPPGHLEAVLAFDYANSFAWKQLDRTLAALVLGADSPRGCRGQEAASPESHHPSRRLHNRWLLDPCVHRTISVRARLL